MDATAPAPDAEPLPCTTATVCDGTSLVRACNGGVADEIVDRCDNGLTCSRGRCTSTACAEIETQLNTFLGCRFYTLQIDNVDADDAATTSLLVTNPGDTQATVQLERTGKDGWNQLYSATLAPLQSLRIPLPPPLSRQPGYLQYEALRFSSSVPVSAEHIQSDDANEMSTSSGGTMLLPVQALGRRYMTITYPQISVPKIAATPGSLGGAGQVVILATEDMTHLTFQAAPTATLSNEGGAPARGAGGSFDITLQEGDAYAVVTVEEGDDFTGSTITSDQPVAVFSGNISTTYGRAASGINSPDMTHEQLLPEASWGDKFVAAELPPQAATCDSLFGMPGASLWRIVAATDGTAITFDAPPGVTGLPASGDVVTLNEGEVFDAVVSGGSFTVAASGPVEVMQGMDCEPTMSPAINASAAMLTDLRFALLPNFDQLITVVRPSGVPLSLDEGPVDDAAFSPAGTGFEVAQIEMPVCPPASGVCTHHLSGQFGMTLRGMDVVCSYALTAPTWVTCDNPTTPGCVP